MRRLVLTLLAAAALAPLAVSQAQTADQPVRKPGWWEMQVTISGPTPEPQRQTVRMCTDANSDKIQSPLGVNMPGPGCPTPKTIKTATGWTVAGACDAGQMKISANAVATGDFNSRYHVDIDTRLDPPPVPQAADIKIAMDAQWAGQCPAGRKPGDIEVNGALVAPGSGGPAG